LWAYLALAVLLAVLVLLPVFVKNAYILHLCIMSIVYSVLGMSFSMLYSAGRLSLGAGTFYLVGAYISTLLTLKADVPVWASLPLTTALSGVLALAIGAVIIRGSGFSFGIITLLLSMAVISAVGQIKYLGGYGGFTMIPGPEPIGSIQFTSKPPYYYLALILLVIVVACFAALYSSRIGRTWRAIKNSPELAQSLGINLYRHRLLAFVVSSMAVALFGSFYVHYNHLVEPTSFGGFFSINIQLYSVLGGLEHYLLGPVIGAIIMTFVPEQLRVINEYNTIVTGLLLIVIILFFRGGIIGIFKSLASFRPAHVTRRLAALGRRRRSDGESVQE
jgi:branched-chain amino acid transport system permease protein